MLSNYTSHLQITSFVITKSVTSDRLISWIRIANLFSVAPIPPDLPDPSFIRIHQLRDEQLVRIWLDVANMFHNQIVLPVMVNLFLFPPTRLGYLEVATQNHIIRELNITSLYDGTLLRPAQKLCPWDLHEKY